MTYGLRVIDGRWQLYTVELVPPFKGGPIPPSRYSPRDGIWRNA